MLLCQKSLIINRMLMRETFAVGFCNTEYLFTHNEFTYGGHTIFLKKLQVQHIAQDYITASSMVYNLHQAQHIISGRLP